MRRSAAPLACALLALSAGSPGEGRAGETEDAATAWKRWKDISAAVSLRPLDGPQDIIEKSEIIRDRIDELERERERLELKRAALAASLETLERQLGLLRDLEGLRLTRDSPARQRIHELSERIHRIRSRLSGHRRSLEELVAEIARLSALDVRYLEKAQALRAEESRR